MSEVCDVSSLTFMCSVMLEAVMAQHGLRGGKRTKLGHMSQNIHSAIVEHSLRGGKRTKLCKVIVQ